MQETLVKTYEDARYLFYDFAIKLPDDVIYKSFSGLLIAIRTVPCSLERW